MGVKHAWCEKKTNTPCDDWWNHLLQKLESVQKQRIPHTRAGPGFSTHALLLDDGFLLLMEEIRLTTWYDKYPRIYRLSKTSQVVFSPDFWTINSTIAIQQLSGALLSAGFNLPTSTRPKVRDLNTTFRESTFKSKRIQIFLFVQPWIQIGYHNPTLFDWIFQLVFFFFTLWPSKLAQQKASSRIEPIGWFV